MFSDLLWEKALQIIYVRDILSCTMLYVIPLRPRSAGPSFYRGPVEDIYRRKYQGGR